MPMTVNISVRELVGFVLRSGSADSISRLSRMREGTRLHKLVQERAGEGYFPEVPLSCDIEYEGIVYHISGRADGIIDTEGSAVIDEIKSTSRPISSIEPEDYPEYIAQADCYGYMYALKRGLAALTVRLTFIEASTHEIEYFDSRRTLDELRLRLETLLSHYHRFAKLRCESRAELIQGASHLKFPYREFRQGQSDIVLETYRTLKKGQRLLIEAPTGIGKTLSVCYGAVKALGDGIGSRIFYLTPKSTVGAAPLMAFERMRSRGLKLKCITLAAKERCCFCRDAISDCSSLICEFSNGHYDRISDALYELISNDNITPELTSAVAAKHRVCPYELSLDAAMFCDVIICDCNYFFDPRVHLRRFFGEGCNPKENIVLIDEAHDLVDRARDMFSSELSLERFALLSRIIPESDFILYKPLKNLIAEFHTLGEKCSDEHSSENYGSHLSSEPFEGLCEAASDFAKAAFEWLNTNGPALEGLTLPFSGKTDRLIVDEVRDAAYAARDYFKSVELSSKNHRHLVTVSHSSVSVASMCIDPSLLLAERFKRCRAAVLFSATLSPMEYFSDLLLASKATLLKISSPFDPDRLFVSVMDKISLRYADRERTVGEVARAIDTVVNSKRGNYLVFLPSYSMLNTVAKAYYRLSHNRDIIVQKADMTISERESFISRFTAEGAVVGFAVIGGAFAESIDLVGQRLIGTIIVGTGLAKLNIRTNIIADYFSETREMGFEYAYLYPAMNKVLQAIGRVIRTEDDRGVCVLIDDRFATRDWAKLFPDHMRRIHLIGDVYSLENALLKFWDEEL